VNVATVTATQVGTGATTSASDNHSVNLFQPSVALAKAANRATAAVGDTIVYTYTVDNTGSSDSPALVIDTLVDDNGTPGSTADDLSLANGKTTFVGGDTNNDGRLALTELWTYTASRVVVAGDADPLVNTAVVHAHPLGFTNDLSATASASVDLFQPAIAIDKTGNALSKIGDPVTYTYTVTNAGSAGTPALENVVVTDDNATPGVPGDDFSPTFVGGDTNNDGKLDKGETWTYTKTLNIPAGASDPYVNVATVTAKAVGSVATVSASDNH